MKSFERLKLRFLFVEIINNIFSSLFVQDDDEDEDDVENVCSGSLKTVAPT